MKVLLVNGSPRQHGCTDRALKEMKDALEKEGIGTELLWIGARPIGGCLACGSCHRTGKGCVQKDIVSEIGERLDEFDGFAFGSPVYYAGPSGQLQCFLDRLFYAYGKKAVGKPGAAIVSCRRGGGSVAYDRINRYFGMHRMPIVSSNYWNQVHGNTPEEVEEDLEGLQTIRVLGREMARILKAIGLAKKEGIYSVEEEEKVRTNFIRQAAK